MRTAWGTLAARRARSPPQRGAAYPRAPLRSFRSAPSSPRTSPRTSPRSCSPACSWSSSTSATAALMSAAPRPATAPRSATTSPPRLCSPACSGSSSSSPRSRTRRRRLVARHAHQRGGRRARSGVVRARALVEVAVLGELVQLRQVGRTFGPQARPAPGLRFGWFRCSLTTGASVLRAHGPVASPGADQDEIHLSDSPDRLRTDGEPAGRSLHGGYDSPRGSSDAQSTSMIAATRHRSPTALCLLPTRNAARFGQDLEHASAKTSSARAQRSIVLERDAILARAPAPALAATSPPFSPGR
jgi:hypothetical protein